MYHYRLKLFFLIIFISILSCDKKQNLPTNNTKKLDSIDIYLNKSKNNKISYEYRKSNLEKAFYKSKLIKNKKKKIEKIKEISREYFILKDPENFKFYNDIVLNLSLSIKDSLNIAESYFRNGIYYRDSANPILAYDSFFISEKIYSYLENSKNIEPKFFAYKHGKALLDLGKILLNAKDYSESEDLTIRAIKKFNLSDNQRYIPQSYTQLGIIAKHLQRYEDAIKYYKKVIEYTKNTEKDTLFKVISYNNIGTTYKSKKEYDKAIKYYKKALSYREFLKSRPKRYARYIDNLGYAKFLSNKDNDSAFYLLNKAYQIRDSINDLDGLSTNSLHLAEYYQHKSNSKLAKQYSKKTIQAATGTKDNNELLQAYDLLAQVSLPEEGRQYAMKYIKLSDSLTKRDNLFRDKFARIRFESDNLQKENEKKSEEIEEKSKEIQEVQNQNTIYLLGMLLLVTFIAFIIYFSRQRTRYLAQQNKIVEFQAAYETETRISKRLHDELGNDIFQVMMQYQNDPHDPQITKKLNTAYNKARDISRENSEFEVDETYTEELTDMLTNYTENHSKLILRGIDKVNWDTVDKNLKITIYRVLQELMTNMQKHSQADLVAIVFKNEKNKLLIKYSDNGIGIEQEDIKSKNGLRNTEKRVQAIQGNITFDSAKDKGFKAEIKIPV